MTTQPEPSAVPDGPSPNMLGGNTPASVAAHSAPVVAEPDSSDEVTDAEHDPNS